MIMMIIIIRYEHDRGAYRSIPDTAGIFGTFPSDHLSYAGINIIITIIAIAIIITIIITIVLIVFDIIIIINVIMNYNSLFSQYACLIIIPIVIIVFLSSSLLLTNLGRKRA